MALFFCQFSVTFHDKIFSMLFHDWELCIHDYHEDLLEWLLRQYIQVSSDRLAERHLDAENSYCG